MMNFRLDDLLRFHKRKILNLEDLNITGVARNFDWERVKWKIIVISLKNHNFTKSRNFRSPKSKIKGRWGRRAPSSWRFLKICY